MKLSALLLLFPLAGHGATYYVANSGADGNAGTRDAPWASLWKVSGATLAKGDSVLLKRGDTWREILRAKPGVYYGAYGEGQPPTVSGGTIITQWTQTGDVWRFDYQGDISSVTVDGVVLPYATSEALTDGAWFLRKAGGWTSLFYRPIDADPHTVERYTRHAAVEATNAPGAWVDNLQLVGSGIYATTPVDGLKITRNRITRGTIWIGAKNGQDVKNVEVSDNLLVAPNEGIFIGSNTNGTELVTGAKVLRNTVLNAGRMVGPVSWAVSRFMDKEGIGIQNMRDAVIAGNVVVSGAAGCGIVTWTNNTITAPLGGNIIERNYIAGPEFCGIAPGGAGFAHSSAVVRYNELSGGPGGALRLNRDQMGESLVYGNSVYGDVFFNSFPGNYSVYGNGIKGAITGNPAGNAVGVNGFYP